MIFFIFAFLFIMLRIHLVSLTAFAAVVSTVFVANYSILHGEDVAKNFWFAGVMCFVSLLIPFQVSKGNRIYLTDVLFGIFAGYVGVNYFWLNGKPEMGWWTTLLMAPLYVGIRGVAKEFKESKELEENLLVLVLVVCLIKAGWGMLQIYEVLPSPHALYRITGAFYNPGPYSGFLALGVPIGLGFFLDKTMTRWKRILGIISLGAIMLVLPAAMSRAAWVAAAAGCLVVLWGKFGSRFKGSGFRLAGRFVLAVLAVGLAVGLIAGAYMMKKESVAGRFITWSASMEAFKEHSLFGVGYGRFTAVYGDAQANYFLKQKRTQDEIMTADTVEYAFNEYVQIAVELGIVGLALFLVMVGTVFRGFLKRMGTDGTRVTNNCEGSTYVLASFVAFLVFAVFSYPFSVLPLTIMFVILLAILAPASRELTFKMPVWLQVAGAAVCMGITTYGAYEILTKREPYYRWTALQMVYQSNTPEETTKQYAALYSHLQYDKFFLFEYGRHLSVTGQHLESNRLFDEYLQYGSDPMVYNFKGYNFKELGEYQKAEDMHIRALQIAPNRFYPLYLLMRLYLETGYTDNAKIAAEAILAKPVKVQSQAVQEMQEEARKVMNGE